MTKLEKHDQESVERARKLLLEKFFGGANGDRLRKKEVVRQLLGTIIAVRNDGMSFQDIAKVFAEAGLELNEHTLRLYFVENHRLDDAYIVRIQNMFFDLWLKDSIEKFTLRDDDFAPSACLCLMCLEQTRWNTCFRKTRCSLVRFAGARNNFHNCSLVSVLSRHRDE